MQKKGKPTTYQRDIQIGIKGIRREFSGHVFTARQATMKLNIVASSLTMLAIKLPDDAAKQ